jgi:ABC-type glycerol-3-phosphate transport system substrate-binding protein
MQGKKGFSRRSFLQMSLAAAAGALAAGSPLRRLAAQSGFEGSADFWDWEYAPRQAYMQQLIEEWQAANPGVTLNYTTFPWGDLGTKLLTANEAEQNPPISNVHNEWRPALQRAGLLAPYPEDLFDYSQLASTPYLRAGDGNIYTSTFGYYCSCVFLNTDMLAEDGLTLEDVPANWADFVEFAKTITRYDANGNVERPGVGLNHYYSQKWLWQDLVYQAGGFLYNEDGTEALWNSEEGVQALQLISDWYHVHKIDDPLLERHFDMFYTDRAAGFISHGYWAGDLIADEAWEGRFGTTPEPTWTGEPTPAWGMVAPEEGLAVFANYPEEVQAAMFSFIQYALGTDERRIQWAKVHAIPTDRLDLLTDPAFTEGDEGNVLQSQAVTIPYRINPGEQPLEADTYFREMFERVILNVEEPQAVLEDVTGRFNAFLAEQGQTYLITERSYTPPSA